MFRSAGRCGNGGSGRTSPHSATPADKTTAGRNDALQPFPTSCADEICQTTQPALGVARFASRAAGTSQARGRTTHQTYLLPGVRATVVASSDKAYGESDDLPYLETHRLEGTTPYDVSQVLRGLDLPDLQPALGVARLRLALREHLARGRTTHARRSRRSSHRVTRPTASRTISLTWKPIVSREPRPTTFPSPART